MEQGISGQEGVEAFITLVESLQAKDDYGAYETTYGALRRLPAGVAARGLVASLPRLVKHLPDHAGDILAQLANATRDNRVDVLGQGALAARFSRAKGEKPGSQYAGECRARVSCNSVRLGDWASVRYGHNVRIIVRARLRSTEPRVSGRDGWIAVRLRKTDLCGGGDSIT